MKQLLLTAIIGLLLSVTTFAQTKLPAILSDNMCLQHSADVTIWGWDTPGQEIKVAPSWNKKGVKTRTNEAGKWTANIATPKAGGPHKIKISGSQELSINNVLLGEVWICSGQSNMDRQLGMQRGQKPIVNFWEEAQKANRPTMRLFVVLRALADEPQDDLKGKWVECNPESVLGFSAAGYFFGKKLQEQLQVPMGLIESSWGGTPVEGWTRKSAMNNDFLVNREREMQEIYLMDSTALSNNQQAFDKGYLRQAPKSPPSFYYKRVKSHRIGHLYNAMIHPLIHYRIKGAIWYQGESNRNEPQQYAKQFPNMIQNWRDEWGIGDFPFYFVQIAPYYYNNQYNIPPIWEAQYEALNMPNVGMASTQDIGQIYDIHPPEKEEVGRRLALVALHKTYGQSEIVYSGPVLTKTTFEGNQVLLEFDPMGGELFSAGSGIGGIRSFYISGERRIFYPANVKQDGNRIILTTETVDKPIAVRYLWNPNANASLFNSYGLPAAGFRSDAWEDAIYED
ncbi:MAG: sialate O-acetylesterase [Bacteroidota bacterium]